MNRQTERRPHTTLRGAWQGLAIGAVLITPALASAETIYKSVGRDGAVSYSGTPPADAVRTDALQFGPYGAPLAPSPATLAARMGHAPAACDARSEELLAGMRDMMAEFESRRLAGTDQGESPAPLYGYAPGYAPNYAPLYPGGSRLGFGGRFGFGRGNLANQPPFPNTPFGPPGNSLLHNDVRIHPERPAGRLVVPSGSPPPAVPVPAPTPRRVFPSPRR